MEVDLWVGLCLGLNIGLHYIEGTCGKIGIICLHVFLRGGVRCYLRLFRSGNLCMCRDSLRFGVRRIEGTWGKIRVRCLHVFSRGGVPKAITVYNTYDTREPRSKD